MLRRIDRLILRVPHLAAAVKYYREVLGLQLVREDGRLASLKFPEGEGEVILHTDPDLPAEAVYYLVDDVRGLFAKRAELKLQFIQPPATGARGFRAAIRDPFGNVLLIVDRSADPAGAAAIEDAKAPGALFAGVEPQVPAKREELIKAYEQIGRTADDLPYTPEFEKLFGAYSAHHKQARPTRQEVWRHLLNLRKGGKLPKLGAARSVPPEVSPEALEVLKALVAKDIGRRDRLPYTDRFDAIVDEFNRTQPRALSPHLVWRLVATMAK